MATRVIENRRDRLVTILVAPLMSCTARLPVYTLLIAAFVPEPDAWRGWFALPWLHGLVMFAMYSIGIVTRHRRRLGSEEDAVPRCRRRRL